MPKLALSHEEDEEEEEEEEEEEDDLEDTPLGPSDGTNSLNSHLFLFAVLSIINTCSTGKLI
jgi:hypothetical protein